MAEVFSNEYKEYDESLNLGLDKIFVLYESRYVKLSDLAVFVNRGPDSSRKLQSYADFKRQVQLGNVYLKNGEGRIDYGRKIAADASTYSQVLTIPTQYESTHALSAGESIYHGLKRVNSVNKETSFNLDTGKYVYLKLDSDADYSFLPVEQIGYYEGGSFVPLTGKAEDDFKDKNLFTTDGKRVGSIYTERTFTFGSAIAQEQINLDDFTRSMYELDADGKVVMETVDGVTRPKMTKQAIDRIYSDHTFRKINNQARLEVRNYQKVASGEGEYVQVVLKGETSPVMVSLSALFTMNNTHNPDTQLNASNFESLEEINKLVGQPLLIEVAEGNYVETEPLTLEQCIFTYNVQKQRIETTSQADIMADNSLLMLEDGRYIKEKSAVRPIAYEFATDATSFDALYVKYTDRDGREQGVIVPKDTFNSSPTRNINGIMMHVNNAFRIKKSTKPLKECDVIQTTNKPGQRYHECCTLKSPSYEAGVIKTRDLGVTQEQINGLTATMIDAYKKGEYALDEVIDDHGNLVKLDDRHKRYIETDYRYETDYANGADHYNFLKMNPLTYDAKKDKLIGGPHFDARSANKDGFKVWGDWAARFAGAATSLPGILVLFSMPALAVTLGAAAVGSAVAIPVINALRAYRHNHRQYKYRDKTEYNRQKITQQVEKELQKMYDQAKEEVASIDTNASLNNEQKVAQKEIIKRKFLDKFSQVEQTMDALHTSKYYSEFKVENRVAQVNEGNAPLMSEYREMMNSLKVRIEKLKKQVKKHPERKAELDNLQAEYEGKLQSYVTRGKVTPMDKSVKDLENKAQSMCGLVLAKFFGERLTNDEEMTLEDEIRALKGMEYNNGVEFDPSLTKDEKKALSKADIEAKEKQIDENSQKLIKKRLLSKKSRETKHVAETVSSSIAPEAPDTPEPPVHEEREEHREEGVRRTNEMAKSKARAKALTVNNINKYVESIYKLSSKIEESSEITDELQIEYENLIKDRNLLDRALETFDSKKKIWSMLNKASLEEAEQELKRIEETMEKALVL